MPYRSTKELIRPVRPLRKVASASPERYNSPSVGDAQYQVKSAQNVLPARPKPSARSVVRVRYDSVVSCSQQPLISKYWQCWLDVSNHKEPAAHTLLILQGKTCSDATKRGEKQAISQGPSVQQAQCLHQVWRRSQSEWRLPAERCSCQPQPLC